MAWHNQPAGRRQKCKSGYGFHCWGGRDEFGAIRLLRVGGEYLRKYTELAEVSRAP